VYDQAEIAPGLHRFVMEHMENVGKVLLSCELGGAVVSVPKTQWFCRSVVIVGYICGTNGRSPEEAKVKKLLEWRACRHLRDVRAFLGLVGFYRLWIKDFAIIARLLVKLTRKDVPFVWEDDQAEAMKKLQAAIVAAPVLVTLDYSEGHGEIILMTDASLTGWGAALMQIIDGKRRPARYESGTWTRAESQYDATKRECRGLLAALRHMRRNLYGIHFNH
jgi:hypothetical protein